MKMLAAIFGNMQANEYSWREPIAGAFDLISDALTEGIDPDEVAAICHGAAKAIRSPERHSEIQYETQTSLHDRKAKP